MWCKFTELNPTQQIVAQLQLDKNVDTPPLKKLNLREFLVVDNKVKGSRLIIKRI